MISECIKLNHWKFLYTSNITQYVLKSYKDFKTCQIGSAELIWF